MTDLVDAYQRDDIHLYESVLQSNKADVLADPFIAEHIDEVTRNMRTKAILKLIAPYTRFTLGFVATQLKISTPEVQDILGFLIVDKKVRGKINQQNGTVEVESKSDIDRVESMREWSLALGSLWATIFNDGEGFRSQEPDQMLQQHEGSTQLGSGSGGGKGSSSSSGLGKAKAGSKGKGIAGRIPGAGFK
jgi:COP9 signalosome complex subunit 2